MNTNNNKNNNRNDANSAGVREEITPDRLIEASIAVMKAVVEVGEVTGGPWPYPPDLMGSPMQPRVLCDFTRFEVDEATAFLIRMGMLEAPKAKGRR